MKMKTKADVLALLSRHVGRDKGVPAETLARALDMTPRQIRAHVTELRSDGVAVCGHPSAGYFIAATSEELDETCQFLRERALHSLTLESKLRNVPLPDLLGQLRLNT